MGYYTNFRLEFDAVLDEQTLLIELNEFSEYNWESNFELFDAKWYNYRHQMKIISSKYPETLFTLYGNGEEPGDIWVEYFKGGKSQFEKAKIMFDNFDETKLED